MKSDLQLQRDVQDELRWEPSVNAAAIGVSVTDGIVTLTGPVETFAEKRGAVRSTQRVAGVRGIADNLEVRLPHLQERTDADIARAAIHILEWNVFVPHGRVTVTVHNGWITLEGVVEWQYQRAAAEHAVHSLRGVRGVTNVITVKPAVTAPGVKAHIEAALRRRAAADGQDITVDIRGPKAILSGSVRSWAAREEADAAAWAAPGVYEVENRLIVVAG
jgi:osmotically-inducible protein OsmY